MYALIGLTELLEELKFLSRVFINAFRFTTCTCCFVAVSLVRETWVCKLSLSRRRACQLDRWPSQL